MKKLNIIFVLIFTLFFFYGCNINKKNDVNKNNSKEDINVSKVASINNTIAMPDSIIIYNHGKKIVIDKKDKKYNEIINQVKTSISKLSGRYKCILNIDLMKSKGILLELVYNNTQEIQCSNLEDKEVIKYSNIYFNLESKGSSQEETELVDFGDGKGALGPIIEKDNLNKLKNILN